MAPGMRDKGPGVHSETSNENTDVSAILPDFIQNPHTYISIISFLTTIGPVPSVVFIK